MPWKKKGNASLVIKTGKLLTKEHTLQSQLEQTDWMGRIKRAVIQIRNNVEL